MKSIDLKDLESVLGDNKGTNLLREALESTREEQYGLLKILLRYAHFNFPFAGSMASLAGTIACRRGIFRDSDEKIPFLTDCSLEIAASIFFAAIDEFGGPIISPRHTHHLLARQTIAAIAEHSGYKPANDNMLNQNTIHAANQVSSGYRVNEDFDTPRLFEAIGFHIGSEILAAKEFQIIDSYLREKEPQIVLFLQERRFDEGRVTAYHWISAHLDAEPKHLEQAIEGANLGLRYYVGKESKETLRNSILKGFHAFASLQTCFMQTLAKP